MACRCTLPVGSTSYCRTAGRCRADLKLPPGKPLPIPGVRGWKSAPLPTISPKMDFPNFVLPKMEPRSWRTRHSEGRDTSP